MKIQFSRIALMGIILWCSNHPSMLFAQEVGFLHQNALKDELTAFKVIRADQLEKSGILAISEILRRFAPQIQFRTLMGRSNFALYFDGIKTESDFIDETDVDLIERIVIWRGNMAPIYYRTATERFVVLIERKDR